MDRRQLLIGAALGAGLAATGAVRAQWGDPPTPASGDLDAPAWPSLERHRLWPGRPPGAPAKLPEPNPTMNGPKGARELWLRGIPFPELHVFRPPRADGSAMLALPGGGYSFLSVQNEGLDLAQHFVGRGTTVFVLAYRLPGEGWANRGLVPLQDAQRAMRIIRFRAREFGIDPARLGVVGFSAGGHLAADLSVAHAERAYAPIDAMDQQSARPDWAALVYAVTSLRARTGHRGSAEMLLGPNPTDREIGARSPVLRVTAETPPSFLVHSLDDPVVPLENSLDWIAACRTHKVPVEAHLFEKGGHGFGLHLPKDLPGSRWPDLLGLWLRKLAA